jgi:hypothetical protein
MVFSLKFTFKIERLFSATLTMIAALATDAKELSAMADVFSLPECCLCRQILKSK